MTSWQQEAYGPVGALKGRVETIAVTDVSTRVALSTLVNIYPHLAAGRLCMADADSNDIYYIFSADNAGTVDDTNHTAGNATQGARIPGGMMVEFRPPVISQAEVNAIGSTYPAAGMCEYVILKCASGKTATLRLSIISEAAHIRNG